MAIIQFQLTLGLQDHGKAPIHLNFNLNQIYNPCPEKLYNILRII